jgi:Tfp pilus assembly protein PilN
MKAVNLLPPDLRGVAKPAAALGAGDEPAGRMGAFAVIGALAFCVVALAAYVLTTNTVKDRRAQLDQVSAEAATAAQQAARLKPYADFAAQAQERVQTVKDLASARFDWEQALRDVSRAVPAAVTLSSLNGTISSTSGGSGGSSLRAAIPAPAIEMQGCTTGGQSDVATLLSRLRAIDGVTRVSLQSSQRPTPGSQSAVTASPTGAPAGCGAKRPAQFNLVVFFEHSTVPATVDDVSTGAAAPASGTSGTSTTGASTTGTSTSSSTSTSSTSGTSSSTSTPTSTTATP